MTRLMVVVAALTSFAALVGAHQSPAAMASVSGVVSMAAPGGQPIARAVVTISGPEIVALRAAITDDNGRFTFDALPAGRYTLAAKKPAYLAAAYGATRPGRPGIELALTAGQRVMDVRIAMTHGAAIAGVIRDRKNVPLPNAQVSVIRRMPAGTFAAAVTTMSDDRGQYRIFGLVPGEYFVTATESSLIATTAAAPSSAEIDATFAALRTRAGSSPAGPRPASTPTPVIRPVNLSPVFYPGVLNAAEATSLKVAAGDDRGGTDITIRFGRTASIVGGVAPAGPEMVVLTLVPRGAGGLGPIGAGASQTRAAADGTFKFPSVNSGSYLVEARSVQSGPAAVGAPSGRPLLWGRTEVEVTGDDLQGVSVTMRPAQHLSGRVVFEGTSAPPDPTKIRVLASNGADDAIRRLAQSGLGIGGGLSLSKPAAADGSFDLDGVMPGPLAVTASPVPAGWTLRSVTIGDKDALDVPFEVPDSAGPLPPVMITFTDQHSSIRGTLQAPSSQTTSTYTILAFASDRTLRGAGSRRVQLARVGTDALFQFKDLPPGDYFMAALSDVDSEDLLDPAFFEQLTANAIRLTLGSGEQKVQNLRIGGL